MPEKEKVLLGMSGGVDSSTSAILLQEAGYEVIGVTMNLTGCNQKEAEDAKRVCEQLKIKHYVIDETEEFQKRVVDSFVSCYQNCLTPNPCVNCNRYLKFGKMYEFAQSLGINKIATGHYAKIEWNDEKKRYILKKSASERKDQSYVLYCIPQELLEHVVFPLEGYHDKKEIRQIAEKHGLNIAKKPDSQDICFIPDKDYASFLERKTKQKLEQGKIVNRQGKVLGTHNGLYHYTIGQRKGLGIANPVPLFVLGLDKEKNQVIVGEERELYQKECMVGDLNWLCDEEEIENKDINVKIRYHAKEAKAMLKKLDDKVLVCFQEPQKGITPGQSAVFYQEERVIGGGKIEK